MGRLHKLWSLSRREKGLLCEAGILFLAAKVSVHTMPFRKIERYLRAHWGGHVADICDRHEDIRLIRLSLSRAGSLFRWKAPCLSRSIAEFIMLRRRRIPAVMYMGVKVIENSALSAHAWVEASAAGADRDCAGYANVLAIGQVVVKSRPAPRTSELS
jgi:Transglutaminase-like superfamily